MGVLIPDFDSNRAKPVVKFLDVFANEYFSSGRASTQQLGKSENQLLKESANNTDARYFKNALAHIVEGFKHKSIHQIVEDLDKLNRIVNR